MFNSEEVSCNIGGYACSEFAAIIDSESQNDYSVDIDSPEAEQCKLNISVGRACFKVVCIPTHTDSYILVIQFIIFRVVQGTKYIAKFEAKTYYLRAMGECSFKVRAYSKDTDEGGSAA